MQQLTSEQMNQYTGGSLETNLAAVLLLEQLCNLPTVVARPQFCLVEILRVHLVGEQLGVAVSAVPPAIAVRVVIPRLHLAVLVAEIGIRAVARPCRQIELSRPS